MVEPIFNWEIPYSLKTIFFETYRKTKKIFFTRCKISFRKSHVESFTFNKLTLDVCP
jgi:hypothetical protein